MRNSYYSKFYKETKSLFPFFGKSEKAYLRQYQSEIDTYLEEFPDSSYNDMKERIGSPKDVIFSYYDNIENDEKEYITYIFTCSGDGRILILQSE